MTMTTKKTGWVACDYTQGDRLEDVSHSEICATYSEALDRQRESEPDAYEGIRYVAEDGYLYVDEPDARDAADENWIRR